MANSSQLPLHEKSLRNNNFQRVTQFLILLLLLSLLIYRLQRLQEHGFIWLLAFFCESWFTFNWFLVMNMKWNLCNYKTYPNRLLQIVEELPPVDLFVTTADPVLEPPIITVNTVLSLLALDYPANKLACYVSDDGASPLTFYSLVEATKFADSWIPFCKKYNIQIRAPFQYFCSEDYKAAYGVQSEFTRELKHVKEEYELLCNKIKWAEKNPALFEASKEFSPFSNIDRRNHKSIVKVICEYKDDVADRVPHLVYVSREKRPERPHHYKAGAMNVLTRVSGVMTNSPFMLNVDCDMFANNPEIVLHAMCLLLGSENENNIAFVQCPQLFYGGLKDDPFGNSMIVLQEYLSRGMGGIQGPAYGGTGCFHRRKVIYGASPCPTNIEGISSDTFVGNQQEDALTVKFGYSEELLKSVSKTLVGLSESMNCPTNISRSLHVAIQVASCSCEDNTIWGDEIGWVYGSCTEDVLTGIGIHKRGWRSVYCSPDPPAFLGSAPSGGPAVMTQQKRWATGLLEIILGNKSPIIGTLKANLSFRQCLAYLYINLWGLRSIPELCYAILPAYCLLTNTSLMPKVYETAAIIPTSLLAIYSVYTLAEYLTCGQSVKSWWNNQRMMRITTSNAFLFGVLSVILKLVGMSDTVFEITRKDQGDGGTEAQPGRFTFDDAPVFVPGTTLVLLHITGLVMWFSGLQTQVHSGNECGISEIVCSALVLLSFLPFVKGLYRKGIYGIPSSTIWKSVALVALFIQFCRRPSTMTG